MKVQNGDEDSVVISPVVSLNIIDCTLTTKSRKMSGAIEIERSLVKARDPSYPPNVSVARVLIPAST